MTPTALGPTRHLGIDLGATNLKWVLAERHRADWSTVARDQTATRFPADPAAVPAAVVAQMAEIAERVAAEAGGVQSVGVGVPGLYDPATGSTRFLVNVPGPWDGQPVAEPLGRALGVPVHLINDARAFGLAELRLGAGRGASSMVGLTLGTGVGGVFAIGGHVYQGRDGTGGELGHQTLDPDGPPCNCGNNGCLEAFARADRLAEACGTATAEAAVERARAGDPQALAGIRLIARYLGIGIANMITVLTPDRVVIGGGIAAAADLLFDPIREELVRRVRTTALEEVSLVVAELGTWAGAIGAAVYGAERAADDSPGTGNEAAP
jgi:glucokinase